MCVPGNANWHQHSHLLEIVKHTEREYFIFPVLFFKWLFQSWNIAFDMSWNESTSRSTLGLHHRFPGRTTDGMSGMMKLFPVVRVVLVLDCSVHLYIFFWQSHSCLVISTPSKNGNDNGFYLMFFLLPHSPICSPICQCHLCLRLSEFSFTLQTVLFLPLTMMLIV